MVVSFFFVSFSFFLGIHIKNKQQTHDLQGNDPAPIARPIRLNVPDGKDRGKLHQKVHLLQPHRRIQAQWTRGKGEDEPGKDGVEGCDAGVVEAQRRGAVGQRAGFEQGEVVAGHVVEGWVDAHVPEAEGGEGDEGGWPVLVW